MKTVTLKTGSCDSMHETAAAVCREAGVKARWAEVFVSEGNAELAKDYARQLVSLAMIAVQLEAVALPCCDAPSYVANKIADELGYQRIGCHRI